MASRRLRLLPQRNRANCRRVLHRLAATPHPNGRASLSVGRHCDLVFVHGIHSPHFSDARVGPGPNRHHPHRLFIEDAAAIPPPWRSVVHCCGSCCTRGAQASALSLTPHATFDPLGLSSSPAHQPHRLCPPQGRLEISLHHSAHECVRHHRFIADS